MNREYWREQIEVSCSCGSSYWRTRANVAYNQKHNVQSACNKCLSQRRTKKLHAKMAATKEERFWKRIKIGAPEECWPWLGVVNDQSYGKTTWNRKHQGAHRVAYMLSLGATEPPDRDVVIRHLCHNPICCNPSHLKEGNHQDNMQDSVEARRFRSGEQHHNSKLTVEKVVAIRLLCAGGIPIAQIAKQFSLNWRTVKLASTGETWASVE